MRFATTLFTLTLLCLSYTSVLQANGLRSGLQEGDYPFAFYVSDITGPAAGQRLCYRCNYGARPVVSIFTRTMNHEVAELVKEIDNVVGRNRSSGMAAFVVVLTDDPDTQETTLRKAARQYQIEHAPLTVFNNDAGPGQYKLSEDADVTVMMWVDDDVKVNHVFRLTDLTGDAISRVVADTRKILN